MPLITESNKKRYKARHSGMKNG